jgi:hypothetical protein
MKRASTAAAAEPAHRAHTRARIPSPGDAFERQADRMAGAVLAGTAAPRKARRAIAASTGWAADAHTRFAHDGAATDAQGLRPLGDAGQPLPAALRTPMEAAFGHDFGAVRVHRGDEAAQSAAALHARAYTSGSHIVLGAWPRPWSAQDTQALVAHELAHVVQQSRHLPAGAAATAWIQRQPTALSAIPESERRALRVGTVAVSVPAASVREYFTIMPSGNPSTVESVGATNSFGTGIAATLRTGLGSVAAYIAGSTNGLPLNSSIEVDLDLSAHGGANTTYRFTYFEHTTGRGRAASTARVMLIEEVGAAIARPAVSTAPSGAFSIGSTNFTLSGTWSDADYSVLREALTLLPPAALTAAANLTLRRRSGSPGTSGGHYDTATDTVELNDRAFPATTNLRFGQRPAAVRAVLHEVAHALDLRPLEQAWQAYDAAGQTAAARRTLLAARSRSGSRWGRVAGSTDTDEIQEQASDVSPAFRAAVRRDGVRPDTTRGGRTTPEGTTATLSGGVTTYSDTDYQELFAESFALYASQPETLRLLRPATYAYFLGQYPRP